MTPTPEAQVPLWARVRLGHAAVQRLAEACGADVLHIKGEAIDPPLVLRSRHGTDVDILARPAHAPLLLGALTEAGWTLRTTFSTGSPFEHAATLHHPVWGYVDVHRHFPGISAPSDEAFSRLWRDRQHRQIGGVACDVPSISGQVLILVLNAARNGGGSGDVATAWQAASEARKAEVLALVRDLEAELAFTAATEGDLDAFRGRRDYSLWLVATQGGTRVEEWMARVKAAPDFRAALRVALRAPLVNTDELRSRLGRPPTRSEVAVAFGRRVQHALGDAKTIMFDRRRRQ